MRRRFVIDFQFQSAFTLAFVRGILVALLIPGAIALVTLYLMSQSSAVTQEQKALLVNGLNHLGVIFLWSTLIVCLVFVGIGAYLSHRFIGPLTRLESWSDKLLKEQHPGPLKLRKGDELTSVADVLNRVIGKYYRD